MATQQIVIKRGNTHAYPNMQRKSGRFSRMLIIFLLLLFIVYTAMLVQVYSIAAQDNAQPADAIIVLGAAQWGGKPSPVLQARLDHALYLYQRGLARHIITTGGVGNGDRYAEATVAAEYLKRQGVPPSTIESESTGRSTWQSLQEVRGIMQQQGWRSAILVSDAFHMWRANKMAADLGITTFTSPTRTSPIGNDKWWELQYALREPISFVAYLFGLKDLNKQKMAQATGLRPQSVIPNLQPQTTAVFASPPCACRRV